MRIAVVVPALNEAGHIERCLASVLRQPGEVEPVVVDGGSADATAALAARHARVLSSARGRAVQMNTGARHTRAEVLLFLHADCVLHPEALAGLRGALADPRVAGGTFTLRFDHGHPLLRFYALCTALPWRVFHYGDQGIFVRRAVFDALDGFREIPLMEDVDFLRRLGRRGRVALVPRPITTSARRFRKRGIVRQQILNTALVAAYALGAPPERLARWYRAADGGAAPPPPGTGPMP